MTTLDRDIIYRRDKEHTIKLNEMTDKDLKAFNFTKKAIKSLRENALKFQKELES